MFTNNLLNPAHQEASVYHQRSQDEVPLPAIGPFGHVECCTLLEGAVRLRRDSPANHRHEECMSQWGVTPDVQSFIMLMLHQAQWDALEAAGALNSSQWPSWKDWDQLSKSVKKDRLKCRRGVAVAEKGNPDQTFRCNNVCANDDPQP